MIFINLFSKTIGHLDDYAKLTLKLIIFYAFKEPQLFGMDEHILTYSEFMKFIPSIHIYQM
jgi:hypothetical protein